MVHIARTRTRAWRVNPENIPDSPKHVDYQHKPSGAGGQHQPPSGDTTRSTNAELEWFHEELQRAVNRIDWSQPF